MANIAPQSGRRVSVWRRWVAGGSGLLWAGVTYCYALRPDRAAAVTLYPSWLWLLPGLLMTLVARPDRRTTRLLLGLWVLFLGLFAEEPWSLLRPGSLPQERRAGDESFRVVSLNCAGGSPEAADEVAAWKPDLVLLQEVPAEGDVARLARRLYGAQAEMVYGYDTAVLAQGKLSAVVPARAHSFFVVARVEWGGRRLQVVSLRLTPPVVRMDLWSPACWAAQTANRRTRRAQVAELKQILDRVPAEVPQIVGGDFNAPAGDAVGRMLEPRFRDAFVAAGAGWGNTGLNDIPVSRVDQIWVDRGWQPRRIVARRTLHSDHRMVVADLFPSAFPRRDFREPSSLRTPLMFAARAESPRLVSLLIARGAEVNAVGLNNDCALDYAEDYGRRENAYILARYGALRR